MKNDRLVAGDTLDFVDTVPDYPVVDGWTLVYMLVPQFTTPAQTTISLTAITEGDSYRVQAAAAVTASWVPGAYSWFRWVEKSGVRQIVGTGTLEVTPDPATVAQGYDGRTDARAIYDGLLALWKSHSAGQGLAASYQIAGRAMQFKTSADLVRELGYWKAQVEAEDAAERAAAGMDSGRKLYFRMGP